MVGVISVIRSPRSTVPAIEDADLLAALAMRFGRTVAVPLVLASAAGVARREPASPEPASPEPPPAQAEVARVVERAIEGDVEVIVTHEPEPESEPEAEAAPEPEAGESEGGGFDDVALLRRSIESRAAPRACRPRRLARRPRTDPGSRGPGGHRARPWRGWCRSIGSAQPPGGLAVSVGNSGDEWRIEVRPRELIDGWPEVPELDSMVRSEIRAIGGEVALQATAEHGWVIELAIPGSPSHNGDAGAEDTAPAAAADEPGEDLEVPESSAGPAIDLMAASLGDTRNMIVLALDLSGRVLFCNDELAQRLGGGIADLLGRPLHAASGAPSFVGRVRRAAGLARAERHGAGHAGLALRRGERPTGALDPHQVDRGRSRPGDAVHRRRHRARSHHRPQLT